MSLLDRWRPKQLGLLFAILLGTLLGPLDSSVNIAFPDITHHFGIEIDAIRWVVVVYVSTYASLMLVFGRIGDLFGHRRVFILGLLVCIAGLLLCSLANQFELLLISRVVQGVGTAMVLSCGAALATHLFDEDARARILGLYAMSFGVGGALGPALGGTLVDHFGWTAAFWSRIPLAAFALCVVLALKLESPPRDSGQFSAIGSIGTAVVMGAALFTVSQLDTALQQPVRFLVLSGLCVLGAVVVRLILRANTSLTKPSILSNLRFLWINAANLVVNLAASPPCCLRRTFWFRFVIYQRRLRDYSWVQAPPG